jgi:hypothetical protein
LTQRQHDPPVGSVSADNMACATNGLIACGFNAKLPSGFRLGNGDSAKFEAVFILPAISSRYVRTKATLES